MLIPGACSRVREMLASVCITLSNIHGARIRPAVPISPGLRGNKDNKHHNHRDG